MAKFEKSPLYEQEDFDDERWDEHAADIPMWAKGDFSIKDWLSTMTPVWLRQLARMRKEGYLNENERKS